MTRLAISLLLLAGLAGAQDTGRFRRVFSTSEDVTQKQRLEAIEGLGDADSVEIASLLVDAYLFLENEAGEDIERRRPGLQRDEKDRSLNPLRKEIDEVRVVQEALENRLQKLKTPEAIERLVDRALGSTRLPLSLRLRLIRRAESLTDDQLVGRSFPRAKSTEDLLVALRFAESLGPRASVWVQPVLRALKHKESIVREHAAAALARMASPESIEPLIERLGEEEGRTQERMGEALEILTRQPIGTSKVAWDRWLEAEGQPYVSGNVKLGGGKPTKPSHSNASRYHSIPVDGESVLYLIDSSLSMNQTLRGKQADEKDETRWMRARDELIRVLGELSPEKRFNIVHFAGTLEQFQPKMVKATPANVRRAQQWLREIELKFGTAIYDALERAFIIAGRGTFDRYYECQVDTIFLLTDGRPYVGNQPDDPKRILAAVKRWNALNQVTLHVIGLGNDVPRGFLKSLATDQKGSLILERAGDKGTADQ
ncbi:MAG: VWA domain-containing protein [Planctomycetota bacterium]